MNDLSVPSPLQSPFDQIKHVDGQGEYWLARELQPHLGYTQWRNFEVVIRKGMSSCKNFGGNASDHITELRKMVQIGSGAARSVPDYRLTRYGCYLVSINGDPDKAEVSAAQNYFVASTYQNEQRRQKEQALASFDVGILANAMAKLCETTDAIKNMLGSHDQRIAKLEQDFNRAITEKATPPTTGQPVIHSEMMSVWDYAQSNSIPMTAKDRQEAGKWLYSWCRKNRKRTKYDAKHHVCKWPLEALESCPKIHRPLGR